MSDFDRSSYRDALELSIQIIARNIGNACLLLDRLGMVDQAEMVFADIGADIIGLIDRTEELYRAVSEAIDISPVQAS